MAGTADRQPSGFVLGVNSGNLAASHVTNAAVSSYR